MMCPTRRGCLAAPIALLAGILLMATVSGPTRVVAAPAVAITDSPGMRQWREDWRAAIAANRVERLRALLADPLRRDFPVDEPAPDGKTALMAAAARGDMRLFEHLLDAGANPAAVNAKGASALLYAAWDGNAELVRRLLALGVPIEQAASNGWTAVMMAAAKGRVAVLQVLLAASAQADGRDVQGWTPLMRACDLGRLDVVELLLRQGRVNTALVNPAGQTALHIASGAGHKAIAERLIAAGADPAQRDYNGATAADLAARYH